MSFLQESYNRFMDAGGDHVEFVVCNGIPDQIAAQWRMNWESRRSQALADDVREYHDQLNEGDIL